MDRTTPARKKTFAVLVWLVLVGTYAVVLRCLHLLDSDHYYILSPDSHLFHWQAQKLLSGEAIPFTWHSGLTYPLAYAARLVSFVSGMHPADALTLVSRAMPPALGVVSLALVFVAASKMYGRRVGLWAAFSSAVFSTFYFVQASGYLDRDGLSLFLLMAGVFVFHFSRGWHVRVAGRDVGWMVAGVAIMGIEALLFLEWVWFGVVILMVVLAASVVVEVTVDVVMRWIQPLPGGATPGVGQYFAQARASISKSNWRPLVLAAGVSIVAGLALAGTDIYNWAVLMIEQTASGSSDVAELQAMTAEDLYAFGFLIIPLLVGLWVMVSKHRRTDALWLGWFFSIFAMAIFARRVFIYAAPATGVICGVGLAAIFDFQRASRSPTQIRIMGEMVLAPSRRVLRGGAAVLLVAALVLTMTAAAYGAGSPRTSAADREWQSALAYLKESTPEDSVIMSWWDYGYWILDMADRRPVVDNGYIGWDQARLEDVGLAYCTTDPSVALQVMQKYGADYLVFSQLEVPILPAITPYGVGAAYGDRQSVPAELQDSLYNRSLFGDFRSGGGLKRVYPSDEAEAPEVVILGLE